MMLLLAWLLAVYGAADVISHARIGAPFRRLFPLRKKDGPGADGQVVTFAHLIRCPKCVSVWIGIGLTFLELGPAQEVADPVARCLLNGFAAGAWTTIAYGIVGKLQHVATVPVAPWMLPPPKTSGCANCGPKPSTPREAP